MIQVNIKRKSDNQIGWSAIFDNQELAENWVLQESQNRSWGESDRWLFLVEGDPLIDLAEDSREVDLGAEQTAMEYFFSAQYIVEYVDLGNEPLMESLRIERNRRLAECDWTQLADSPLSSEDKTLWANYRQALRDLPQQEELDLENPSWPSTPNL